MILLIANIVLNVFILIALGVILFVLKREKQHEISFDPQGNSVKISSKRSSRKPKIVKNPEWAEADKETKLNQQQGWET